MLYINWLLVETNKLFTTIKNDLLSRKAETENVLHFVKFVIDNTATFKTSEYDVLSVFTSLKSNVVLMLYNAVEATVTNCLQKIHVVIKTKNLRYKDLTPELQKICIGYHRRMINCQTDLDSEVDVILDTLRLLNSETYFLLSYDDLIKYYQLYSGNLDAKKIGNVLNKYGIIFEEKCSELKFIKDNRNILAHGEKTFEEVGRDVSIQQLQVMTDRTFEYLLKLIENVELFLVNKKYCSRE